MEPRNPFSRGRLSTFYSLIVKLVVEQAIPSYVQSTTIKPLTIPVIDFPMDIPLNIPEDIPVPVEEVFDLLLTRLSSTQVVQLFLHWTSTVITSTFWYTWFSLRYTARSLSAEVTRIVAPYLQRFSFAAGVASIVSSVVYYLVHGLLSQIYAQPLLAAFVAYYMYQHPPVFRKSKKTGNATPHGSSSNVVTVNVNHSLLMSQPRTPWYYPSAWLMHNANHRSQCVEESHYEPDSPASTPIQQNNSSTVLSSTQSGALQLPSPVQGQSTSGHSTPVTEVSESSSDISSNLSQAISQFGDPVKFPKEATLPLRLAQSKSFDRAKFCSTVMIYMFRNPYDISALHSKLKEVILGANPSYVVFVHELGAAIKLGTLPDLNSFCSFLLEAFFTKEELDSMLQDDLCVLQANPIYNAQDFHYFSDNWRARYCVLAWNPQPVLLDYTLQFGPFQHTLYPAYLQYLREHSANLAQFMDMLYQIQTNRKFLFAASQSALSYREHKQAKPTGKPSAPSSVATRGNPHASPAPIGEPTTLTTTETHTVIATVPTPKKQAVLPYYTTFFEADSEGEPYECLADPCSTECFISTTLVERFGLPMMRDNTQTYFRADTVTGNKLMPYRTVTATFDIADTSYTTEFIVLPTIETCIFGNVFMYAHEDTLPQPHRRPVLTLNPNADYEAQLHSILDNYSPGAIEHPISRFDDYRFQLSAPLTTLHPGRHMNHSIQDQQFIKDEIRSLLLKGLIDEVTPQTFHATPFVVHGAKPRVVIDYRELNAITVPIASTVPSVEQLLVGLKGTYFTALDLSSAYHHICLTEDTKIATTFKFQNNYYCWNVLAFGLRNSPEVFSQFLSRLLAPVASFTRNYVDDIIIASNSPEEHLEHITEVLKILSQNHLNLNVTKSTFYKSEIDWVGHHLSSDTAGNVVIDPKEGIREKIKNFPVPTTKRTVQSFLGHFAYISKYIPHFSTMATPLYGLTNKEAKFDWSTECQEAFDNLLHAEEKLVTLHVFTPGNPIKLTTDASNVAVGAVLWQQFDDAWYPILYKSKTFNAAQRNWSVIDKEMFAIRYAVREFKFYLASADILLETDHKPILAIFQKVDLTAKQSRWLNDMLGFQLTIRHIPGKTNELADYLSRLPLHTATIPQVICHSIQVTFEQPWIDTLVAQLKLDEFFGKIYDQVLKQEGESIEPYTMDTTSGFLYYKNRLCVPSSLYQQVLDDFHSSYLAGHPGVNRMTLWLTKHFYFPKMHTIIKDYVGTCDHCWQVKSKTFTPGSLQPLETPVSRWSHISMDIVSGFTPITAQGITYDSVLVTVDLFSNHVHFTPINANFSGDNLVEYLVTRFFPLHGFPQVFVGDQGPQFTSALFTQVLENLGINYRFSVAKHHESNGKVERYIRILEDYLRLTVDKNEDWLKMIPLAEYTINSTPSMALGGASPFEVDVGYVPPSPLTMHYSLEKGGAEADDITEVLDRFANTARVALKATFDRNKLYYDQKRKGDEFEVGDLVFTAQSALVTPGSAHNKELVRSLQTKFVGPFEVIKKDSAVNYRLLLPDYMKRTNLFHISQLRKRNSIPDALIVAPVNPMTSNEFASSSKLNSVVEILDYKKVAKGYNLKARLRDGTESWLRRSDVIRKCPDQYRKFVKNHPELERRS